MSTPEAILTFAGWGSIFLALYLLKRKRANKVSDEKSD
jgi:hypothetical protein